ncbi:hypothetical protein M501DRAFT_930737 [Patellaria atrata CBS 101060]|uniref:UbiA prenyltransferase n=1 Tax=Patellaria atrata CBS 101060 TaxID=1346257 RepID=A0A9P4SEV5_9PEZI|nr:hypothetical protein M501DRAFT_930737 [Patellaria atrata CBS 101060]
MALTQTITATATSDSYRSIHKPITPQKSARRSLYQQLKLGVEILYRCTYDNTPTFVGPNATFGICGALAGSRLIADNESTFLDVMKQMPWVILFNWTNLLIFDLANQRNEDSAKEDQLNKPWRPIPMGLMTTNQMRQLLLVSIPLVLAFNHYVLDVGVESALILILTWLYNDLRGGDENFVSRNAIIAAAFGVYNIGSMKVAASFGTSATITNEGYMWAYIVSGVIMCTMHVQDLQDQAGDRVRGRNSAPIILGDMASRWTVSLAIPPWIVACTSFWHLTWLNCIPATALGMYVAWRCLYLRNQKMDRRTWQLWCLWQVVLYTMPLVQ